MNSFVSTLRSSFLAGVSIGIAGFGYLMSKDIIGIVLFTFGLLAVVHYGFKLYTGTVGFCGGCKGLAVKEIPLVLLGNLLGTLAVALLTYASPADLQGVAQGILESRLANGPLRCGLLAIGCGFIMTLMLNSGFCCSGFQCFSRSFPLIFRSRSQTSRSLKGT